jgi:hypothetical protein
MAGVAFVAGLERGDRRTIRPPVGKHCCSGERGGRRRRHPTRRGVQDELTNVQERGILDACGGHMRCRKERRSRGCRRVGVQAAGAGRGWSGGGAQFPNPKSQRHSPSSRMKGRSSALTSTTSSEGARPVWRRLLAADENMGDAVAGRGRRLEGRRAS